MPRCVAAVVLMLALALFDEETIGDRKLTPAGGIQMLLGGMGLLNTFPLFATLGVEMGWWASFMEVSGLLLHTKTDTNLKLTQYRRLFRFS